MESRITIEVDFERNNSSVIQIALRGNYDVKDKLIRQFIQSLSHSSRWCRIEFTGDDHDLSKYQVRPITLAEIPEEIKLMQALVGKDELIYIPDNSIGFREFLDENNIAYKGNGHSTGIPASTDLFMLGQEFERYRRSH